MQRRWMTAAIAALGIACAALAAEQEPKPAEGPKPPPEVEKLSYFLGPWTSEGELKAGPLGSAGPTQGREVCRWMPGRFFVGCMIETKTPTGLIQVQGIYGYDAEKKVYRWWSFDNLGHAETATGTLKDDTWTWTGDSKFGEKTLKARVVLSAAKPEGYGYEISTSMDGKSWTPLMTGKTSKMTPKTGLTPGPRPIGTPAVPPGQAPAPAPTPSK
jgi:hypothetical protein